MVEFSIIGLRPVWISFRKYKIKKRIFIKIFQVFLPANAQRLWNLQITVILSRNKNLNWIYRLIALHYYRHRLCLIRRLLNYKFKKFLRYIRNKSLVIHVKENLINVLFDLSWRDKPITSFITIGIKHFICKRLSI